jgi:hypothetical protein
MKKRSFTAKSVCYTATTRLLINSGRLHSVRVEGDAIGDQGEGGSVNVEKTNQELLCK